MLCCSNKHNYSKTRRSISTFPPLDKEQLHPFFRRSSRNSIRATKRLISLSRDNHTNAQASSRTGSSRNRRYRLNMLLVNDFYFGLFVHNYSPPPIIEATTVTLTFRCCQGNSRFKRRFAIMCNKQSDF
jgi:hypothetical protein